jgi:hypothetical protein
VLSNLERWVSIFDFCVKPSHDEAPFLPLQQVIARVVASFNAGGMVKLYNNNTRAIRISDLRYDEDSGVLTLLVQLSDTRMADPVFAELDSGSLRVEPKLDGEGIAVSAHFVISSNPTAGSADHYKAIVECVPGITKSTFEPFLNAMLRKSYENEEFVSPISKKRYKLRPVLNVFSHASETLEQTLLGARLQGIRLVSTRREEPLDKNPYTDMVEKAVKMKVVKQPGAVGKRRLLASLRARANREGYTKLVISYSKNGKQTSVDLDVREDAATKLFTKMEKIVLPDGIEQCEPNIHEDMEERMIRVLNS